MKKRTLQIALEIALLRERYAERDILEAVQVLEEMGSSSALLDYLASQGKETSKTKISKSTRPKKQIHEQRSKAIVDLETTDPEKHKVLAEFDYLLRKGSVLPGLEDIRRLGEGISKDFAPRKSRRDAISKLMTLLAQRSIDEINDTIQETLSNSNLRNDEFQKLAEFTIEGNRSQEDNE